MSKYITIIILLLVANYREAKSQLSELVVLGITQDAGYPQIGCTDNCCSGLDSEEKKAQHVASIGFSDEEKFYLIDATPDFSFQYDQAQTLFPGKSFGGVFLTHAHIGHYLGLAFFGREAMGSERAPVYVMPRMKSFLERNGPWSQLVELGNIELIQMTADVEIKLSDDLRIRPFTVPHRDEFSETVGFELIGNRSVIYIPDIDKWRRWDQSINDLIQTTDIAFVDGTFYDGDELPNRDMAEIPHPFILESMQLFEMLSDSNRSKIHFIHLNHTNPALYNGSEAFRIIHRKGYHVAQEGERFRF